VVGHFPRRIRDHIRTEDGRVTTDDIMPQLRSAASPALWEPDLEPTLKDPYQVLKQKEMDIERVRKEIEALHLVIPLLAEDADWIENGLAPPQLRATGTAGVRSPQASRSTQI
jgi:hypothetical protein